MAERLIKDERLEKHSGSRYIFATTWNNKTQNTSKLACEAIISFFVQHCEVFYEITE